MIEALQNNHCFKPVERIGWPTNSLSTATPSTRFAAVGLDEASILQQVLDRITALSSNPSQIEAES